MQEVTVKCGCGRMMTPDGRAGRGAYRCGCGVRIRMTEAQGGRRNCWYRGCPESATTNEPLDLCSEHERETVHRLAHLIVRFDWGAVLDASVAIDAVNRPVDGYRTTAANSGDGWVYFMRRERLIKIGTTTDVLRRAKTLNATVLAKCPGSYNEERRLHAKFAAHRRHGEWFEPVPELMQLINAIRAEQGLPKVPD
ncbi:GIY-YIG nuclease family protein [Streptomyces sp. NPDC052773]|uniref:GIY-YIG nuclease family protein n=1 Tax=Streptomyces sp. NPDC052773 TaxID=3365693 RepID=UPI0037D98030